MFTLLLETAARYNFSSHIRAQMGKTPVGYAKPYEWRLVQLLHKNLAKHEEAGQA